MMRKRLTIDLLFAVMFLIGAVAGPAYPQREGRTTFTGTAVIYGTGFNTRTITRNFTLHIIGQTPPAEAQRLLGVLQSGGQDALLRATRNNELGRFSLGGNVGRALNAVVVDQTEDGKQRIRAVFDRWVTFGELRYGYRSADYPFSYIELIVDPRTGRGEGSYFQAARIRARGNNTVEIEDFGTWPSRLMGVQMRGRPLL
jgi:hypothetical protein